MKDRKVVLKVAERLASDCPSCGNAVTNERPDCQTCGQWLSWGDAWLFRDRIEQANQTFIAEQRKAARAWLDRRDAPESGAPPLSLRWRLALAWHQTTLGLSEQRRVVGVATVLFLVAGVALAGRSVQAMRSEAVATRIRPGVPVTFTSSKIPIVPIATGICADGSDTYAKSRAGACSNHGGVSNFYSDEAR